MSTNFTITQRRRGITLLIVLALMVMFAMLVTAFMVIVSQQRRAADTTAQILLGTRTLDLGGSGFSVAEHSGEHMAQVIKILLTGSEELDNVIAPHSILENLYGNPGASHFLTNLTEERDRSGKPLALRPNVLAPNTDGTQTYKDYLENPDNDNDNDVRMNPDYTAPDYMTMFLAWNDVKDGKLERIIPSFHRPQLVKYWQSVDDDNVADPTELRKYVLRPLPTDHPDFTGSNPAATKGNLDQFLTEGPWDVDNDGDGIADGIWLDFGLPLVHDNAADVSYKPLVSVYVIDMEGRINVNTTGNTELFPLSPADDTPRGMGLGPAELSSTLLTSGVLQERYGTDNVPDGTDPDSDISEILRTKHGINYEAYTNGGLAADWFGTTPIDFDKWGNREPPETSVPPKNIPYLMNPYSSASSDNPFMQDDLQSLLFSVLEANYNRLSPHRLRELLEDAYNPNDPAMTETKLRYSLTTRGSDIPAAATYLPVIEDGEVTGYETFEQRIIRLGISEDLLPKEIIQNSRKVNLNRLTLESDWMDGGKELLVKKARFAQEIFYLMQVLFPERLDGSGVDKSEALERLAQWSVNLVDFIDPDDVMTPFIFNTDSPWGDNTDLISSLLAGTLSTAEMSNRMLIWGFEKPEVALTETFAIHNRNVQDTANNPSLNNFVQKLRPQGSLFVELYRQGNSQRTLYPANSVVEQNGELNLTKKTSSGDYVWRLAIGEAAKTTVGKFEWEEDNFPKKNALQQLLKPGNEKVKYPQFYQWLDDTAGDQYHPDLGRPERFVWFGKESPSVHSFTPSEIQIRQCSFFNVQEGNVILAPNSLLVVAPRASTTLNSGQSFFDFSDVPNTMIAVMNFMSASVDAGGINISEPLPTTSENQLVDGYKDVTDTTLPLDTGVLKQRGTIPCYKTICLQRLADPNRAHHPICNPYLTVDWNMIDLQVINSHPTVNESSATEEPTIEKDMNMHISSRQWKQTTSKFSNLWDRTLADGILQQDKAGLEHTGYNDGTSGSGTRGILQTLPKHGLGTSNYPDLDSTPFLHFPWHDAPFMNTGELMLVPASAPGRFGVEFHDNGTNQFYGIYDWLTQTSEDTNKPRFGYYDKDSTFTFSPYPNWAGEQASGKSSDMVRLFDFVHIPSRFADEKRADDGTVEREPGKINLNTVTEAGWETLRNGRTDIIPDYETFRNTYRETNKGNDKYPSEFRPFRSPSAVNLVPPLEEPDTRVGTPIVATLFRLEELINDGADNPYLALEKAMRLSDVTTTRSNVFAVWITIGYFEVKLVTDDTDLRSKYDDCSHINRETMFNAVYPPDKDGKHYVLGTEKGVDDGTVYRHRSFYLIDRSIPVAPFKRGAALDDVKNVILLTTPLD